MAEIRFEFGHDHDLSVVREARQAVDGLLFGPADPIRADVLLVVSELVTNTVLHANSDGLLRVSDPHPDVPLRVEVEDRDPTMPHLRSASAGEDGGFGLEIVSQLADAWGIDPLVDGKRVWAVFDRTRRLPL